MKKISVFFLLAVLLVSCSPKNSGTEKILENLKGEWVYQAKAESEVFSDGSGKNEFSGDLVYGIESRIVFSEDGSFVVTNSTSFISYKPMEKDTAFTEEEVKAQVNQSNTMDGRFEITPKVLTMNYNQIDSETVNYVLEDNRLVLTPNYKNAKSTVYYKSE